MSDDLIARMKSTWQSYVDAGLVGSEGARVMKEAADRIAALEAEVEKARADRLTEAVEALRGVRELNRAIIDGEGYDFAHASLIEAEIDAALAKLEGRE